MTDCSAMRWAIFVVVVGLGMTSLFPGTAHSADPSEVLIRKGVDKRRQGDHRGALSLFQEAFDISRSPRAEAQLGLCEQALEMWPEAEAHLSGAIVSQTDAWIASKRAILEMSLKQVRSHMAQLTIAKAPDSALVTLSGVARGRPDDGPFYVRPGDVEISITADNQRFESVEHSLSAGESRTITFVEQAKRAQEPSPNGVSSGDLRDSETNLALSPRPSDVAPARSYRPFMWGAFGLGAASLAVGTYALLGRNSAAGSFNSEQVDGQDACFISDGSVTGPGGEPPSERCSAHRSKVTSMTTLSAVGLIAGVSLAALGAVFWSLDKSQETQPQGLACSADVGHRGITCAGQF